jgi:pilus assembly protein Flp/PilA
MSSIPGLCNPLVEKVVEIQMKIVKQTLWEILIREDGQDMIEYGLMAALLGLGTLAALRGEKTSIFNAFSTIGSTLAGNTPGGAANH